ncbi:hypothetical protein HKCCE2091_20720 [Rhodobacterales bacterium HKCCE2091]|nr:hypothetical protein [Rhodobacterales bacterium HKCCE2091]
MYGNGAITAGNGGALRRTAGAAPASGLSPVVYLTMFALITPVYFNVGSILLTPSRMLFLILIPLLTVRLLMGHFGKITFMDKLIFFKMAWMVLSIAINNRSALVSFAGMNITIILGGYLVGRCFIRNADQYARFTLFYATIVLCMLPLAISEAITGDMIIPPLIDSLSGVYSHQDVDYERRLGFDRAQVLFSHPIHFGLFCSAVFAPLLFGLRHRLKTAFRWVMSVGVGLACFFSVSSGPFLSLMLQIILLSYATVFGKFMGKWKFLIYSFTIVYVILDLLSSRPAYLIVITRLAFNSATAFNRQFLLEHGTRQIERTPFFGIGQRPLNLPIWMSQSIDNYWLADAVAYGLPVMLALLGGLVAVLVVLARRDFSQDPDLKAMRVGWSVMIVSLIFTLATVAIWAEMSSLVYLSIGSGLWMLTVPTRAGSDEAASEAEAEPPPTSRYTRFPKPGTV